MKRNFQFNYHLSYAFVSVDTKEAADTAIQEV